MPRYGSTTLRGYGAAHQRAARALKDQLRRDGEGTCCRCGRTLYAWQLDVDRNDMRGVDADHHELARALGGELPDALACRRCNRSAGATLGNQLRGHAPRRARRLREW
ncbi:hypothetical protein [Pseudonocardia sp. NPDC049635]|uniref:hypothetical protein n=1 Tax=Pseudonocardia sp. NPDC049635 TaxID=3155506 RepID=UPI0034062EC2